LDLEEEEEDYDDEEGEEEEKTFEPLFPDLKKEIDLANELKEKDLA
jgi:hypothetical protein